MVAPVDDAVAALLRWMERSRPFPALIEQAPFAAAPERLGAALTSAWSRGWIVEAG